MIQTARSDHTKAGLDADGRVYSIPPGAPFLPTLANAIIEGKFAGAPDIENDPQCLNDSIIFLPTRRASRAFGVELQKAAESRFGRSTIILPRIRTIGDMDDEEVHFGLERSEQYGFDVFPDSRFVIDPVERQLTLATMIRKWREHVSDLSLGLLGDEIRAPAYATADALYLSRDLIHFMDQVETEGLDWSEIRNYPGNREFSSWWDLTLEFLQIVMETWPDYLRERNLMNPAAFRNQIIDLRIRQISDNPPKGFVVAAGTTGSIPATTRLLSTIRTLENGAVVLPGLDFQLGRDIVRRIAEADELNDEGVASTHAQFGMIRLLKKMGISHDQVIKLGSAPRKLEAREHIINSVMLPAEDTQAWYKLAEDAAHEPIDEALMNISIIEAKNENEEAAAIALVLREVLESPGKTAALVTPDRRLARRVSSELERFNIHIDDSGGNPLSSSATANYLRLMLKAVFEPDDPVCCSAFLKHPFHFTTTPVNADRNIAELLELALVRDRITAPNMANLDQDVTTRKDEIKRLRHVPSVLRALDENAWNEVRGFAAYLSDGLRPLFQLLHGSGKISISQFANAILTAKDALTASRESRSAFNESPGATEIQDLLTTFATNETREMSFLHDEATTVFDAMIAGSRIHTVTQSHPRLHIYGTLEARLQNVDLLILGGLNEGIWPQVSKNDPYLNRPMRSDLSLPLPERRIGLAAHDFCQLSGAPEVVYSRALRVEDTPSVASRWLQRLKAFAGEHQAEKMQARGRVYLDLLSALNSTSAASQNIERPEPAPPVALRPTSLSFTEIETWYRDPYAIYARHVLKLSALPPIHRESDAALRGQIYHAILARFIETWRGAITSKATEVLSEITDSVFKQHDMPDDIAAVWRSRFQPIGEAFLDWEAGRREQIKRSLCEIRIQGEIGDTGFVLRGDADRIDLMNDGTLAVIDYKTGSNPSKKQARTLSPQLTLEGALASRGMAEGITSGDLSGLYYVRLRPGDAFKVDDIAEGKNADKQVLGADEYAELAHEELIELITTYKNPEQGYVSRNAPLPNQSFRSDYDHLARVAEWLIAESDPESGE